VRGAISLAAALGLCGCHAAISDGVANNSAVIEAARKWTALPDCKPLRLNWAHQSAKGDHFVVSAQFEGSRSCMDRWDVSLDAAGLTARPERLGERSKQGSPDLVVTPAMEGAMEGKLRGVRIPVERPLEGVSFWSPENQR